MLIKDARQIKIVHILTDVHIGGAGRYLINLLQYLDPQQFQSVVLCPAGGQLEHELQQLQQSQQQQQLQQPDQLQTEQRQLGHPGVRLITYPQVKGDRSLDWSMIWWFYQALRREKPQVVHTHASLSGRLAARLAGVPVSVMTRHWSLPTAASASNSANTSTSTATSISNSVSASAAPGSLWRVRQKIGSWLNAVLSDAIIAVSQALGEQLVAAGLPKEKVWVIHNGINVEEPTVNVKAENINTANASSTSNTNAANEVNIVTNETATANKAITTNKINTTNTPNATNSEPLKFNPDAAPIIAPIVGAVGRLEPEKGFQYFLEAASLVQQQQQQEQEMPQAAKAEFWIIGAGSQEAELKSLAAALQLKPPCKFLGFRPDAAELTEQFDIYVLSSLTEALPLALLEAMAKARPAVATRVGGVPEIIEHKVNGWLVEPGDAAGLAQAISYLLQHPQVARQLGQQGQKTVLTKFNARLMAQKTAEMYQTLLRSKL